MSFFSIHAAWHVWGGEPPAPHVQQNSPPNGDVRLLLVPYAGREVQGSLTLYGTPDDIRAALRAALDALDAETQP